MQVDARNVGVWRKCISTKVPDMPPGWLDRAGVAIIGETGKHVANNHDVMSLEVRKDSDGAGCRTAVAVPPLPRCLERPADGFSSCKSCLVSNDSSRRHACMHF